MNKSLRIFYWGMLISFLSSLPPGIMNVVGTQISNNKGADQALLYILGFVLAEAIIVRLALIAMRRLTRSKMFFHMLEWMTTGMLIIFSIICFITANSMQESIIGPRFLLPSFITGVVISSINPIHIPFWLGWSTVLMNKEVLIPKPAHYNFYIAGISIGTLAGFFGFVAGGQYFLKAFQSNQYLINCILGFVLFVTAFLQIRKMIFVPAAVRHAKLFRQP